MSDGLDVRRLVLGWIVLLLSLTVHEWAHAWSAFKLGDDTASREGRLTLNPIPHVDPIGTVVLPLLLPLFSPLPAGFTFGWARPVPVNPARFRRDVTMTRGMMITAAAGPLSNVVLAVLCVVAFGLVYRFAPDLYYERSGIVGLLGHAIGTNIALAVFNFLPIPPLDGSRIVDGLLPYRYRPQWEAVTRFSPFLLLAVFAFGQGLLAVPMNAMMIGVDFVIERIAGT